MTANKRIFLNIVATYGRSLFSLACGLFSARWVLNALGHEDFGLYGVVGSIIVFITFFNAVLGSSVTRFYAYAIGEAQNLNENQAREHLKQWFNTALSVHVIVPIAFVVIGYPIGVYAIRHWLTIPCGRIDACVWVFRFSLVTAFVSMFSVPYIAMYTAFQYIAELSLWGVLLTICTFFNAYLLTSVNGDRLLFYACAMMSINVAIQFAQVLRATFKFKACRLCRQYLFDRTKLKRLFTFSAWQFFGNCGSLMRGQACTILTNIYFGAKVNAAYAISNNILGHAGSLSQAMIGAFVPAITTAEGSGDRRLMMNYAWKTSRIGTFLILLFLLPLALEIDEVLLLWLKDPPEWSTILCLVSFVDVIANKITVGQQLAVSAQGNIAKYQATLGTILMLALPIAWILIFLGIGPMSVVFGLLATTILCSLGRVYFGWKQIGMSPWTWVQKVLWPICLYIAITAALGCIPIMLMMPSFTRVCTTAAVTVLCAIAIGWLVLLERDEKQKIVSWAKKRI